MRRYIPSEIEQKWQKVWQDTKLYEVTEDPDKKKIYASPMLPYPSGAGLHIGHIFNYSIADAVARFHRQRGHNVMTNMGWDAFGLPAENYAIKTGTPPAESTAANIKRFKNQLQRLGMSYAWDRELTTSDPSYYKWTQWVFTQLYEHGLAYQDSNLQWWCTECKTVLANEQVVNGCCWRHEDTPVERKQTKQWFFKITKYADALLDELEGLDWPEGITAQQRNWIGRSEGAEVVFKIKDSREKLEVFTTRHDTMFGVTFMVISPEHPLVSKITTKGELEEVKAYVEKAASKSDLERQQDEKDKTGVFSGAYAINPINGQEVPVWIADYVLMSYGTGAVMGVPGHDSRDAEFASKFGLEIKPVYEAEFGIEQKDEGEKHSIIAVVKHWEDDSYIVLDWGKRQENFGGSLFIGGGVEESEDAVEAAKREIIEETGFTDIEFVSQTETVGHNHFYSNVKNKAFFDHARGMLFELKSSKQSKTNLDDGEKGMFKLTWASASKIPTTIDDPAHMHVYNQLVLGNAFGGEGVVIDSGQYDGLKTFEAREQILADMSKQGVATEKVQYRLRDWLISRQRYWGAPIPIIHCDGCGAVPVPEEDLPVILPKVDEYQPTGEASSVLAAVEDWVNVDCPKCSKPAKRETDTLDGYVCSSWYLHRYTDAQNDKQAWDPKKLNYWFPLDFYFGGDHAVAHLLYVRFWNHFFADIGLIDKSKKEPIKKLVYNGYIHASDGRKMSKSYGNVIDPLEIIDSGYGADALRMFTLFIGPYDQDVSWNPNGVPGTYRFLQRVWTLVTDFVDQDDAVAPANADLETALAVATHKAIRKVTEDLESLKFNTAIATCMELVNTCNKLKKELPFEAAPEAWRTSLSQLLQMLAPFAPFATEELWHELGNDTSIHVAPWPMWDEGLVADDFTTVVVQVNGKLCATIDVAMDSDEETVISMAKEQEKVAKKLSDKSVKKVIFVENRLINFVAV